jgi:cysteine-rich repeat protein
VDVKTDAQNCGTCGNTCASGTCNAGECIPVSQCGDGQVTSPTEACDDANTEPGDGCSASCTVETGFACTGTPSTCEFPETEANNSTTAANALPTPRLAAPQRIPLKVRGAITPSADADVFRITLPAAADLRLDTFDGNGPTSCSGIDTQLELLAENGEMLASDDDSGPSYCSLLDPAQDVGMQRLPAGTYYARVKSYDSTIPAYLLRVQLEALCGDNRTDGSEECDDGNATSGDGCSAICRLEPIGEAESNDTLQTANGPFALPRLVSASIATSTDEDFFRFTLSATSDIQLSTLDNSGQQTCTGDIDTYLQLLSEDGTVLDTDDDDGISYCSSIDPVNNTSVRRMAPGTYHVRVRSYSGSIPAYRLNLQYVARCGDGRVSGSEECDGTQQCTHTCERVPVCGDTFTDFPESCDDGNTASGDGCSATCAPEGLSAETEPNNSRAEADASPVRITGNSRFVAAFNPATDTDSYRVQLATAQVVRLETFNGGFNQCTNDPRTSLALKDDTGTTLWLDSTSGLGNCSALTVALNAGTYYVQASASGLLGPESYLLDVKAQANAGAEAEPNNTPAQASPFTGTEAFLSGSSSGTTDQDVFRITVPSGKSLRAEVLEGGTQSCDGNEVDSELELLDSTGTVLASDDDGGRGYCSLLDGTGPRPVDSGASNLTGGTYYLRVKPHSDDPVRAVFNYRLSLTVR